MANIFGIDVGIIFGYYDDKTLLTLIWGSDNNCFDCILIISLIITFYNLNKNVYLKYRKSHN